jgi:hypothetical protein
MNLKKNMDTSADVCSSFFITCFFDNNIYFFP